MQTLLHTIDASTIIVAVLSWVIGQLIVAAAVWSAIRADIRNIHGLIALERAARERDITNLTTAVNSAHTRLDNKSRGRG